MGIVKCKDRREEYRVRACTGDINDMSGRTGRPDLTDYVNGNIVSGIEPEPDDSVLDVGCGSGTLLKMLQGDVREVTGVLPSEEEVKRVRAALEGEGENIRVEKGLTDRLDFPDGTFSKLVCNSVFQLLDGDEQVLAAFKEFRRVSREGGIVYAGEFPSYCEYESKDYGNSVIVWLYYVWRNMGFRVFLNKLRSLYRSILFGETLIMFPKDHYYATEETVISLADEAGLELIDHFPHREIDVNGNPIRSESRYDYRFRCV